MKIIKHGIYYSPNTFKCVCPNCKCEFEFGDKETYLIRNEGSCVICPECDTKIKEEFFEVVR